MDKFTGTEKVMGIIFESKATRDQRLKEALKQKKLQEIKDKEAKLTKLNESKKPVKEAYGDTIREIELMPTPTSQDIPDSLLDMMWDRSANGIVIEPRHEEVPFAWDAVFEIVGSEFIVRGGIGPGGPGYGSVVIKLPLDKASRYYKIFINPDFGQMSEEFVEFSETMTELGWKLKF